MASDIPQLLCPRVPGEELTAGSSSHGWKDVEPVWFVETVAGGAPEQRTSVRVGWTSHEFRVFFVAEDSDPWATLTERDAPLYTEEVFEVFIDPAGDLLSYFEIEVNPLNTVMDLVVRRNRSGLVKNFRWRCEGLRTFTRRTSDGWSAELAIPFASVTSDPPIAGSLWRANFCRIDRPKGRERELTSWSPAFRGLFHVPERFGRVQFV